MKVKLISTISGDVKAQGDVADDGSVTWTEGETQMCHRVATANPGDPGYIDHLRNWMARSSTTRIVVED